MAAKNYFIELSNAFMKPLLRSRWHSMVSKNIMLVTVKGRKSGKLYTTPVNYLQDGEVIYTTSSRERTWWRNLRGGSQASLCLRGEEIPVSAEVVEDDAGVTAQLAVFLAKSPGSARFYQVATSPGGQLNLKDVEKAARTRVMLIFRIQEEQSIPLKVLR